MKMRLTYFIVCALLTVKIIRVQSQEYPSYDEYCFQFKKNCQKGSQQYLIREKNYQKTLEYLKQTNCSNCGINNFSDQSDEEFQKILTLKQYPSKYLTAGKRINLRKNVGAPSYLNWAERGVVTSIKNQGSCGTCWSFSTVAMIQSNLILKGEESSNVDLSEQYLLQCTPYSTCEQGFLYYATETAIKNGIPYQDQLPYLKRITGQPGLCQKANSVKSSPNFQFFSGISTQQIKQQLTDGPLSISVMASSWKNYKSGVHSCDNKNDIKNHAVLLVGYDDNSWILKNQWGQGWGQNGYIRISLNPQNNCGIGQQIIKLSEFYLRLIFLIPLLLLMI